MSDKASRKNTGRTNKLLIHAVIYQDLAIA